MDGRAHPSSFCSPTIFPLHCLLLVSPPGYRRHFAALRDFLSTQVPQVQVLPKEDKGVTGNFEVTVVGTGQVLHSKRHAGQGRAESLAEKEAILEQIQELLDESD